MDEETLNLTKSGQGQQKQPAPWQYALVLSGVVLLMGGLLAAAWFLIPASGGTQPTAATPQTQQQLAAERQAELAKQNPFNTPEAQKAAEAATKSNANSTTSTQPAKQGMANALSSTAGTGTSTAKPADQPKPPADALTQELQQLQQLVQSGRFASDVALRFGDTQAKVRSVLGQPEMAIPGQDVYTKYMIVYEPQQTRIRNVLLQPSAAMQATRFAEIQKRLPGGKLEADGGSTFLHYLWDGDKHLSFTAGANGAINAVMLSVGTDS